MDIFLKINTTITLLFLLCFFYALCDEKNKPLVSVLKFYIVITSAAWCFYAIAKVWGF